MPSWMDIERLVDDDSGGGFTSDDFLGRSNARRKKYSGVRDPITDLGPLGDANAFNGVAQEEPISSIVQPWKPSSNRRSSFTDEPGPAMSDYLKHINNVPDSSTGDYNPSIWRRMLAGLAGGAAGGSGGALQGIKAAQYINEMPYRRAVEDYERKGSALESAAKIEETTNRTRQAYDKEIAAQEDRDADREVKWANSEINRIRAEQAARRITLEEEIKRSTNEISRQRLQGQLDKWLRDSENQLAELEVRKYQAESGRISANASARNAGTNAAGLNIRQQNADTGSRKAGAYIGYMDRLGTPKPPSAASRGIDRRIVEDEIKNLYPGLFDPKTGALKPENGPQYERLIQLRLARRVASSSTEPDSPYEIITEP